MKKTYSILREAQEKEIKKLNLDGDILDVGGDTRSLYQREILGDHKIHTINISDEYLPDEIVDIESPFPYLDATYTHVICFNVLEHIVETQHVIREMIRVTKKDGRIVITTPFLYYIHGSPDDYQRYTGSFYRKMADKYDCEIEKILPIGNGFFSVGYNFVGGVIPTLFLKLLVKKVAIFLDSFLNKVSKKYRKLSSRLPMGYFVVFKKR